MPPALRLLHRPRVLKPRIKPLEVAAHGVRSAPLLPGLVLCPWALADSGDPQHWVNQTLLGAAANPGTSDRLRPFTDRRLHVKDNLYLAQCCRTRD